MPFHRDENSRGIEEKLKRKPRLASAEALEKHWSMQHPSEQCTTSDARWHFQKPKADQHIDVPFIRARELTFVPPSEAVCSDHVMMTCLSNFCIRGSWIKDH
jgi:hypothetical protein